MKKLRAVILLLFSKRFYVFSDHKGGWIIHKGLSTDDTSRMICDLCDRTIEALECEEALNEAKNIVNGL